jgi:hypothetical protein
MISGQIVFQGDFRYTIADIQAKKIVDGRETDGTAPLKMLSFANTDGSAVEMRVFFTPEDFEKFVTALQVGRGKLVELPVGNGAIKRFLER